MDYENIQKEALSKLKAFLNEKYSTIDEAMDNWAEFVENSEFMKIEHSLDVYSIYEDDDDPLIKPVKFYGKKQIKTAWDEHEYRSLLKEKAFIIGFVDFGDDYILMSTDPNEGIAIIYHDYVYCTDNLDKTVESSQKEMNCSLETLLKLLMQKNA